MTMRRKGKSRDGKWEEGRGEWLAFFLEAKKGWAPSLKGRLWRARRELAKRVSRSLLQGVNAPPDHEYEP
jgi:hypothetical protein